MPGVQAPSGDEWMVACWVGVALVTVKCYFYLCLSSAGYLGVQSTDALQRSTPISPAKPMRTNTLVGLFQY